jgi:hypothetical protein
MRGRYPTTAAGKTTLGPLLAAHLNPPAAAFDGDVFYHMVQVGHTIMTAEQAVDAILADDMAASRY